MSKAGITDLITIEATTVKGQTTFQYNDLATGNPASQWFIVLNQKISWIARSNGNLIGYRIDFNQNGSPFAARTITVHAGGISPAQVVIHDTPPNGDASFKYTVTLADLTSDDPVFVPWDGLLIARWLAKDPNITTPPINQITITTDAQGNVVIPPSPLLYPGDFVEWSYPQADGNSDLVVTFTNASPFNNPSPTVPVQSGGLTQVEKVAATAAGNYAYSVSVTGGSNANQNGVLTV